MPTADFQGRAAVGWDALAELQRLTSPDVLLPRNCAGCTQYDLPTCAACYAQRYPRQDIPPQQDRP